MPAGRAPGECKQGTLPGFSPRPIAAREGTGADPAALTPKSWFSPSPAAAPPSPPALLTPPQGAAVLLQPGDGTTAAVGYSQGTILISSGKRRRGESPAGSQSPSCLAPGSAEQALAWLPRQRQHTGSVDGFSMGTVTKEDGAGGGWGHCMGRAGSPRYMNQRGLHAPKPALKCMLRCLPGHVSTTGRKYSFYPFQLLFRVFESSHNLGL